MFGLEFHGFWEGINENGAVSKMLNSWKPLLIRRGYDSIVESDTGNEVGRIHKVICSKKMAEVISKQLQIMHPDVKYSTMEIESKI